MAVPSPSLFLLPVVFTSLNSGFNVFFFTHVLCLDFLSTSGLKYLWREGSREVRDRLSPGAVRLGSGLGKGSRLHIRVRVAVNIHGSQVCTANDAHQQPMPPRAVAEAQQDAPTLFQQPRSLLRLL